MRRFLTKYEWLPVVLLLAAGVLLRVIWLGELPWGLNQDEASAGYEAWSLLNYGVDRCGNSWPVLLQSWGSGQNALYTYLDIPFVWLFGLSEMSLRIPAALCGCLTLPVFWLLARRARGPLFGMCALFTLAVNPWHIMMCRWALESNLLPFFLLCGIYFTAVAKDRPGALCWAALFFGLSLYAYGTAFLFLPVFLVCAVIWLRREIKRRPGAFIGALAIFAVIALPISVCQIANVFDFGSLTVLGVTLPELTATRQSATTSIGEGLPGAWANFTGFLRLVFTQSDGLPFNTAARGGLFYFFGPYLAVLGLVVSIARRKDQPLETPVKLALLSCAVAAFIIDPNINRMNMAWLPVVYLCAEGLYALTGKLGPVKELPFILMLLCFGVFWSSYAKDYSEEAGGSPYYYPGLGECIEYAEAQGAESVYITDYVNQPYIFALFYSGTPTPEFLDSVVYAKEDAAFRQVRSFGKYRFGGAEDAEDAEGEYVILHYGEVGERSIAASFGRYVVCR